MAERNMDLNKCPMPVQDPDVRNKNFEEVALGYTYVSLLFFYTCYF